MEWVRAGIDQSFNAGSGIGEEIPHPQIDTESCHRFSIPRFGKYISPFVAS